MANLNEHSKRASATKSGPGRYHSEGYSKATPPKPKGASREFVLHTANPEKKQRRALIARHGRRQVLRMVKAARALQPLS